MPRPQKPRWIEEGPRFDRFGPPDPGQREPIVLLLDELETLRLADREGLKHEEGAEIMRISRPTFGRILSLARRKVAEALCAGRPLFIEGGRVFLRPPAPGPQHGPGGKGRGPRGARRHRGGRGE
jgi:hypothetical protein